MQQPFHISRISGLHASETQSGHPALGVGLFNRNMCTAAAVGRRWWTLITRSEHVITRCPTGRALISGYPDVDNAVQSRGHFSAVCLATPPYATRGASRATRATRDLAGLADLAGHAGHPTHGSFGGAPNCPRVGFLYRAQPNDGWRRTADGGRRTSWTAEDQDAFLPLSAPICIYADAQKQSPRPIKVGPC